MAQVRHRLFAGFFAVLFLLTSSFVAIAFILSAIQSKNANKAATSSSAGGSNTSLTSKIDAPGQKLAGFSPVASVSQLKITDLTVGSGRAVTPSDTISVEYTGAVAATGIIFQSSNSPISISLSQVIIGWREGIPGMKAGGSRQLLIPASLAYGSNPPAGSGIPANAALVFDVTVKAITSS